MPHCLRQYSGSPFSPSFSFSLSLLALAGQTGVLAEVEIGLFFSNPPTVLTADFGPVLSLQLSSFNAETLVPPGNPLLAGLVPREPFRGELGELGE